MSAQKNDMPVIGIVERVSVSGGPVDILAKIDTGADSSSIWASNIHIGSDNVLRFSLFDAGHEHYTGEIIESRSFSVARVKNSTGNTEVRYRTFFTVVLGGKRIRARFNLSDRSRNSFKVLIGRRTVSGKFIVDVSRGTELLPSAKVTSRLNNELEASPREFHEKYIKTDKEA